MLLFFSSFLSVPFLHFFNGVGVPSALGLPPCFPRPRHPTPTHLHRQLKGLKVQPKAGISTFSRDLRPPPPPSAGVGSPLQSLTQAAVAFSSVCLGWSCESGASPTVPTNGAPGSGGGRPGLTCGAGRGQQTQAEKPAYTESDAHSLQREESRAGVSGALF